MGQLLFFLSKLKLMKIEAKRKQVCIFLILKQLVQKQRPETKWSMHEQAEIDRNRLLRAEPTPVAKGGDDLCIGVKG